jgi:hypothetical protein
MTFYVCELVCKIQGIFSFMFVPCMTALPRRTPSSTEAPRNTAALNTAVKKYSIIHSYYQDRKGIIP